MVSEFESKLLGIVAAASNRKARREGRALSYVSLMLLTYAETRSLASSLKMFWNFTVIWLACVM